MIGRLSLFRKDGPAFDEVSQKALQLLADAVLSALDIDLEM